jgi:hypothetical protein
MTQHDYTPEQQRWLNELGTEVFTAVNKLVKQLATNLADDEPKASRILLNGLSIIMQAATAVTMTLAQSGIPPEVISKVLDRTTSDTVKHFEQFEVDEEARPEQAVRTRGMSADVPPKRR